MEPITIILSALTAGAKLAAESIVGEATADAYKAFKQRIKKKFSGKKAAEVALEEYQIDPDTWQQPLIKALKEIAADRDNKLIDLAQQILEQAGDTYKVAFPGSVFIEGDFSGTIYQGPRPQDDTHALRIYQSQILKSCEHLPLRSIDVGVSDPKSNQKQLSLSQIYISLNTKTQITEEKQKKPRSFERDDGEPRPFTALEVAYLHRRLVLRGDPGSGKSTFLSHMAYGLAANGLSPDPPKADYLPDWPNEENDLIPIQVLLRDFARKIPSDEKAEPKHLWQFVKERLEANNINAAEGPLQSALEKGRAMVLFDGLDEVPTKEQRTFVRDAVKAFAGCYRKCRFIVTCRTLSYEDTAWQLSDFEAFELAPFNENQIDQFVGAWYNELVRLDVVKGEDEGKTLAEKLQHAVRKPDMWRLAPNPLLLTVMALVHTHKGRLPEARALLYEETIDILLWRWEQIKSSGLKEEPVLRQLLLDAGRSEVDLKKVLWKLAFKAHAKGGTTEDPEAPADIDELALRNELAALNQDDYNWAQQIIEAMKLRAGLLLERTAGIFTFPHRTFQEYLAGAHLSSQANFARQATKLVQEGALWREVILLAVGRLVYLSGDTDKPLALVGELCPQKCHDSDLGWRKTWLAGDVLLEMELSRVKDSQLGCDLLQRVRSHIAELVSAGKLQPVERANAGRTLAKLGDPRPGVGVNKERGLPDILWCRVPAGKFWMGSDKKNDDQARDDELDQHQILLPEFYLSRYTVTNAQFEAFVKAGGYKNIDYWPEAKESKIWKEGQVKGRYDNVSRSQPEYFDEVYSLSNHPVVGVTWYEALAFCRWLQDHIRISGKIFQIKVWQNDPALAGSDKMLSSKQWRVLLPSEAEWEKAARSKDKRIYPWGVEPDLTRANYTKTGISNTSAVGCFPAGVSPYGILDMSGNVWEWTCSHKKNYPYNAKDGREDLAASDDVSRVLRGGAFYSTSWSLRCACRLRLDPHSRFRSRGFRVVLSPVQPI